MYMHCVSCIFIWIQEEEEETIGIKLGLKRPVALNALDHYGLRGFYKSEKFI